MFTDPTTNFTSSCVSGTAANSMTWSRPGTSLSRSNARASDHNELTRGRVPHGAIGGAHRRHGPGVRDYEEEQGLNACASGEGDPGHVGEPLREDQIGRVRIDPEPLGQPPALLLEAERGDRDLADPPRRAHGPLAAALLRRGRRP